MVSNSYIIYIYIYISTTNSANHYQHRLRVCLTAVAADMNIYCPVNSSTQVAGQFSCQAYLSIYTNCKFSKAQAEGSGRSASLWRPAIYVSRHSWHEDLMEMFIGQQNFISHAFLFGVFVGWSVAFKHGIMRKLK